MAQERFLSVGEAAQRLCVSPWTIRQWCRAGTIPASRFGRMRWRISSRVIDAIAQGIRRGEAITAAAWSLAGQDGQDGAT